MRTAKVARLSFCLFSGSMSGSFLHDFLKLGKVWGVIRYDYHQPNSTENCGEVQGRSNLDARNLDFIFLMHVYDPYTL